MLRIIITLFLVGLTSVSYADSNSVSVSGFFDIASQDQSYSMLKAVFGPVGNLLTDSASESPHYIFGHMFSVFNKVMLVLNVIVISYTTIFGLVNTANEGEFLGKKFNSAWVPIRSVMGIGLLIPTKSGYCILQILMMWLVLQGVGAADTVWSVVVNNRIHVDNPNKTLVTSHHLQKLGLSTKLPQMMKVLTCHGYYALESKSQGVNINSSGACGSITTPDEITIPPKSAGASHFYKKALKTALTDEGLGSESGLMPKIGKTMAACKLEKGESLKKCLSGSGTQKYFSAMASIFIQDLKDQQKAYLEWKSNQTNHKSITAHGWADAGAYYHKIYTTGSDIKNFSALKNLNVSTPDKSKLEEQVSHLINSAQTQTQKFLTKNSGFPNLKQLNSSNINTMTSGATTGLVGLFGNAFIRAFKRMLVGGKSFFLQGCDQNGNCNFAVAGNPITSLQYIGEQAISIAEIMMGWVIPIALGLAIAFSLCGSTTPGYGVFFAVLSVLGGGALMLFGMLMTFGMLTAVYVPLIPYIVFYFGVIGWLMSVIETLLAAPMVAIGIASPDGQHEVLGRAEPAVMLVTNVFIRPTLMIFGLVAGFLLSLVGMEFLNATYRHVVAANLANSSNLKKDHSLGPFMWLGYIIVYITIVLSLINKSYTMIHQVPDAVLRWIGGQAQFGEYAKGEEEVSQKAQQGQQPVAQMPSSGGGRASQAGMKVGEKSAKKYKGGKKGGPFNSGGLV